MSTGIVFTGLLIGALLFILFSSALYAMSGAFSGRFDSIRPLLSRLRRRKSLVPQGGKSRGRVLEQVRVELPDHESFNLGAGRGFLDINYISIIYFRCRHSPRSLIPCAHRYEDLRKIRSKKHYDHR